MRILGDRSEHCSLPAGVVRYKKNTQKVVNPHPKLGSVLGFLPFYGGKTEARASVIFPGSRMESWVPARTRRLRRLEITRVSCGSEVGHAFGWASERRLHSRPWPPLLSPPRESDARGREFQVEPPPMPSVPLATFLGRSPFYLLASSVAHTSPSLGAASQIALQSSLSARVL